MILIDHIPAVRQQLRTTAVVGRTVSFRQLFGLFPKGTDPGEVFRTLEAAIRP